MRIEIQIYSKIKVHIFSNTLGVTKLDITKQIGKFHNILMTNPVAASMSM